MGRFLLSQSITAFFPSELSPLSVSRRVRSEVGVAVLGKCVCICETLRGVVHTLPQAGRQKKTHTLFLIKRFLSAVKSRMRIRTQTERRYKPPLSLCCGVAPVPLPPPALWDGCPPCGPSCPCRGCPSGFRRPNDGSSIYGAVWILDSRSAGSGLERYL